MYCLNVKYVLIQAKVNPNAISDVYVWIVIDLLLYLQCFLLVLVNNDPDIELKFEVFFFLECDNQTLTVITKCYTACDS